MIFLQFEACNEVREDPSPPHTIFDVGDTLGWPSTHWELVEKGSLLQATGEPMGAAKDYWG
jgi:hypothetical protein